MPKCLSCGNVEGFTIRETLTKTAEYDEKGFIINSRHEHIENLEGISCGKCDSVEIEGPF